MFFSKVPNVPTTIFTNRFLGSYLGISVWKEEEEIFLFSFLPDVDSEFISRNSNGLQDFVCEIF